MKKIATRIAHFLALEMVVVAVLMAKIYVAAQEILALLRHFHNYSSVTLFACNTIL